MHREGGPPPGCGAPAPARAGGGSSIAKGDRRRSAGGQRMIAVFGMLTMSLEVGGEWFGLPEEIFLSSDFTLI